MDKFVEIKKGFNRSLHTKSFSKQSFFIYLLKLYLETL